MHHLSTEFRKSRSTKCLNGKNLAGIKDTVVCLLYIRNRGQTLQTILPLRHAVQWRLCLSHVPLDKVPSSPDICQPSPRCFLPITGKNAGSLARWCVTTKVDVAPLRCHMPPDEKKKNHKPCLDTHGQINVRLTQEMTYVTQPCKKHMMDKEQQYKNLWGWNIWHLFSEWGEKGKEGSVACLAVGTNLNHHKICSLLKLGWGSEFMPTFMLITSWAAASEGFLRMGCHGCFFQSGCDHLS